MRYDPVAEIDGYEIVEELGEGAYAETYLARDTPGDVVVLKSPNPTLFADPAIFQRFRREAEIARTPRPPRRAAERGRREQPDRASTWCSSTSRATNLRERMRRLGRPDHRCRSSSWSTGAASWPRSSSTCTTTASSTATSSRRTSWSTTDDHLKVADFGTALLDGAARLTWKHLTEGLGTPDYMSPEQIQGERGDPRSDIYAWGIDDVRAAHRPGAVRRRQLDGRHGRPPHQDPEPVDQRRRDSRPASRPWCMHAMRRDPEHRYQTAAELIADLDRSTTSTWRPTTSSPEPPMGGMAAAELRAKRTRGSWRRR